MSRGTAKLGAEEGLDELKRQKSVND